MCKVMIVDDEPGIRALLKEVFQKDGYEVCTAADGRQALEVGRMYDFDLIILDLKLPDMSGVDVMKRLHACGSRAAVIILTAYDKIDKFAGLKKMGFAASFSKPFDIHELRKSAEQFLAAAWSLSYLENVKNA